MAKLPAYGGTACPCSAHRPASRAPASSSMLGGIPPPKACVTLGTCSTAPTSGDASSPCSWTIRSGRHRRARGSRSATIGGVSVSPNRRGYMKAARSCGLTSATRACRLPTRSRSSGPASPAAAAGRPAASSRSAASALVAHRTSCPAARNARASGYIGNMCPYPKVEENRTRTLTTVAHKTVGPTETDPRPRPGRIPLAPWPSPLGSTPKHRVTGPGCANGRRHDHERP